jgi:hypothetical protein
MRPCGCRRTTPVFEEGVIRDIVFAARGEF